MPKTEEVIPMVDKVNQEIVAFANAEEAAADKIFYEAQGLEADGKTPLGETPEGEPEEKKEEQPGKETEEPNKEEPKKEEAKPNTEEDLTKDLTVLNADKRITSAQKKMHDSNKRAKDAETANTTLAQENEDLRKLIDQKATVAETGDPVTKEAVKEETPQTNEEIDEDLEKLRTEYPEIAEPMIKMMQRQQSENKKLQDRLDKQEDREKDREKTAKESVENAHYKAIADAHPDFDEISKEPLLGDWIEELPPMERAGAMAIRKDGSTKEVISLLTNFKKANGYKVPGENKELEKAPNKPDSKLDKAKGMSTPEFNKAKEANLNDKQIRFTREQIKGWTEAEWKENEKAVDEAMSLGLVR